MYFQYVYIHVRIRVGVFRPMEPLSTVRQFISDCLLDPSREYKLSFMRNELADDSSRLAQLGLVGSSIHI